MKSVLKWVLHYIKNQCFFEKLATIVIINILQELNCGIGFQRIPPKDGNPVHPGHVEYHVHP